MAAPFDDEAGILRSEVNLILEDAIAFCREMNCHLPGFAFWSPERWAQAGHDYDEIRRHKLGWDVTDFGKGDIERIGLALFTVRNGNPKAPDQCDKTYCEKLLIVGENQVTPYHYHFTKVEDIICRAGGKLCVQVYNAAPDHTLDRANPVAVNVDGHAFKVAAGTIIDLHPGESITLPSYQYHQFWAEGNTALVGEVSKVNDDEHDNHFLPELGVGRFPEIDEDVPPLHLLCWEYPEAPES
jgi:D-lyxose ketol-isomerase